MDASLPKLQGAQGSSTFIPHGSMVLGVFSPLLEFVAAFPCTGSSHGRPPFFLPIPGSSTPAQGQRLPWPAPQAPAPPCELPPPAARYPELLLFSHGGRPEIFPAPSLFIFLPAGPACCSPAPWHPCNIPLPPPRLSHPGTQAAPFLAPLCPQRQAAALPPKDSAPISLSRQRSSSQPSFPRSPSTSTCHRCSTECSWEILCCTQQPRRLRALSARCCVKPSGQHVVDVHRWVAVFAQPQCHRRSPPVRPRRSLFDSASALFSYD
jgi:hypothetical protein